MPICKEELEWANDLGRLSIKRLDGLYEVRNLLQGRSGSAQRSKMGSLAGPSVGVGRGLGIVPGRNPFLRSLISEHGPSLKTSDERFRVSAKQLEATAILQSASSSSQAHPVNQDSSIGLASPKDQVSPFRRKLGRGWL